MNETNAPRHVPCMTYSVCTVYVQSMYHSVCRCAHLLLGKSYTQRRATYIPHTKLVHASYLSVQFLQLLIFNISFLHDIVYYMYSPFKNSAHVCVTNILRNHVTFSFVYVLINVMFLSMIFSRFQ